VIGTGRGAYFLKPTRAPGLCQKNFPLSFKDVSVYKASRGAHFDLSSWTGSGGVSYSVSVNQGAIHSAQPEGAVY
jgi:cyanophycinase